MSTDVGRRLRAVRTAHGFSQRKLATRAGVTNGLISLIEQNKTSPSIASLKLILDAIPMSFTQFFHEPEISADRFIYRSDEFSEINPLRMLGDRATSEVDGISFRQLGQKSDFQIQMLHESYEPGADTGEELYHHEAEEAGVVVSGEIELTVGKEVALLKTGDGYIFDSRKPHRFRNTGTEQCVIISACTPPTF